MGDPTKPNQCGKASCIGRMPGIYPHDGICTYGDEKAELAVETQEPNQRNATDSAPTNSTRTLDAALDACPLWYEGRVNKKCNCMLNNRVCAICYPGQTCEVGG